MRRLDAQGDLNRVIQGLLETGAQASYVEVARNASIEIVSQTGQQVQQRLSRTHQRGQDSLLRPHRHPGGAIGTADIFTDRARMTHAIRHIELRMKSWMNYVFP